MRTGRPDRRLVGRLLLRRSVFAKYFLSSTFRLIVPIRVAEIMEAA
jgi:hypothetical protein